MGSMIRRKVRDGADALFWKQEWFGHTTFQQLFPNLYKLELQKNCTIAQRIYKDSSDIICFNWEWNRVTLSNLLVQYRPDPEEMIQCYYFTRGRDCWTWNGETMNVFSTKMCRDWLRDQHRIVNDNGILWLKWVPSKVLCFLWRLSLNHIPVLSNLGGRGVLLKTVKCPICLLEDESVEHLFFSWPVAQETWRRISWWTRIDFAACGVRRSIEWIEEEIKVQACSWVDHRGKNVSICWEKWKVETLSQLRVDTTPVTQSNIEESSVRRSIRDRRDPDRYGFLIQGNDVPFFDGTEPTNYKTAISDLESDKWLEAMGAEMQSMHDNQVWDLVDLPPNCKTVGSKWVFKKKTDMDGNVHTFKARLVAKGFTQTQGIDYEETFSPVAMLKSIRILIAISAYYDYEIWQMDVKTAFLNGHLTEDVYMAQPEGFVDPKNPNKVCKLKKSIYGLKQASRSWNLRFDEKIKEFGFLKNEDEPCVYMKASGSIVMFLILYVDDILLIGNDIPTLNGVKSWLGKCFAMKDLGEAAYILGIKIYRDRSRRLIGLSQSTYIDKVIRRFLMQDAKRGFLPMAHGTILNKLQCPETEDQKRRMERVPYASAIGSIMYAMLCTRPDVSYALSMTSRYQQNPGDAHWIAVKNILKYLKRTKDMFLIYGGIDEELCVKCYTDASFQTDRDDSRSQTGFVFTLKGGAITWKSSKQTVVAQSTTESEYIAASDAAKEAAWMKKFIADLGVVPSIARPIEVMCDNSGAIAQAKEPRSHHSTKHILRKFHYIREILERGDITINKVHTDHNLADPFTKPMPQAKHEEHARNIGLRFASDWI
ncbi:hypothetical protein E3N88_37545 [Mikania micrantha]|uniref:Reverse transcriptase Ty1/copia-type domain-containing protein n=1 Tax=Mikania micrantha TaxID=192012 RepID=A0A5N6LRG8_9ASTR|nr:hypothetical protein E3N88_37545 [Mikania micrantha]